MSLKNVARSLLFAGIALCPGDVNKVDAADAAETTAISSDSDLTINASENPAFELLQAVEDTQRSLSDTGVNFCVYPELSFDCLD